MRTHIPIKSLFSFWLSSSIVAALLLIGGSFIFFGVLKISAQSAGICDPIQITGTAAEVTCYGLNDFRWIDGGLSGGACSAIQITGTAAEVTCNGITDFRWINGGPTAPDTTAPVRSNGAPSGTLPSGTMQATISLNTDENATCKYAVVSGIDYGFMAGSFPNTGGTTHSSVVTGLSDGNTFSYYVKCQDASGNDNTSDFVISFSVALTPPPGMVFPGATWTEVSPTTVGVDAQKLNAAMSYLASQSGTQGTNRAVVVRNGYLIWKGSEYSHQDNTWSTTKTFTGTVLGLLIDDGFTTLNSNASSYISNLAAQYPNLTLRHLATLTSGYDAGGDQSNTWYDPTTPLFPPGTQLQYWDAALNEFANVLTNIAGQTIEAYFKTNIADPIQMDQAEWNWGDFGNINGFVVNGGAGNKSQGIYISPQQLARFGHLFLNQGNWNGTQLISSSWVRQATTNQVPVSTPLHTPGDQGPGVYGFNWWVNGTDPSGNRLWPNGTLGTYAALGFNNNVLMVIPEWNMVIVRQGTNNDIPRTGAGSVWDVFLGMMDDAVNGGATDTTPPLRSNGAPSGNLAAGTTQTTISLNTDENATCKYSATAGISYTSMVNTFTGTGGTIHSSNVTGLSDGNTYNYYVRCQDASGNANTTDFVISFSVDTAPTPSLTPSSTPVSYWKFDEGSGTIAQDSVGTNNGTLLNMSSSTSWVAGQFGTALNFDGVNDYLDIGNPVSLRFTGAMSISAWAYIDSWGAGSSTNSRMVAKQGGSGNRGWSLGLEGGDNKLYFQIAPSSNVLLSTSSNAIISTGKWYHFVAVYEPGVAIKIYIDGVLDKSNTVSIPASQYNSTTNVSIGGRIGCSNCFFDGKLDSVRVYNQALTASEVQTLFTGGN